MQAFKKILVSIILLTCLTFTACENKSDDILLPSLLPSPTPTEAATPSPTIHPDAKLTYTLKNNNGANGIDFEIDFASGRDIRLLQITDTQIQWLEGTRPKRLAPVSNAFFRDGITSHQVRVWQYVDEAVERTKPDIIVLTGDNIYGETDDSGVVWTELISKMDSYGIPWLIVFGNHDNESAKGVIWQTEMLEKAKNCIFKRGNTTGNSNYNLLIRQGGEAKYLLYMLDTNGCRVKTNDESLLPNNVDIDKLMQEQGLQMDQVVWMLTSANEAFEYAGKVPVLTFLHIPPIEAAYAVNALYSDANANIINFHPSNQGDLGLALEQYGGFSSMNFWSILKNIGCTGIFVGHQHKIATSILYDGIRITYGMKTGTYDYHDPQLLGSVRITLSSDDFSVTYQRSRLQYPHK